ncbi:MAG: glycosyltransferase [Clostridiales bacterium]|nr:glycosyltransferase [Clostridiales bacterium]
MTAVRDVTVLHGAGTQDVMEKSPDSGRNAPPLVTTTPLSIIVPIFNVEQYLPRCLDSLLATDGIEHTELIIVDDEGSKDNSGMIALSYAEKYSFIRYYLKENGGLSDARNYGLRHATGKYVVFFDSDDKVNPEAFSQIISAAMRNNADVLLWDGVAIDENDNVIASEMDLILVHAGIDRDGSMISGTEALVKQILDHDKIAMTAWLRACRRTYLLEHDLFFESGLLHEDELWTPQVLTGAAKVLYIPEKAYFYRIRENSLMKNPSMESQQRRALAYTYIMNSLYNHYRTHVRDKKHLRILLGNWADTYLWGITAYGIGRFENSKEIPRCRIFASARTCKSRLKSAFLVVMGAKAYGRMTS